MIEPRITVKQSMSLLFIHSLVLMILMSFINGLLVLLNQIISFGLTETVVTLISLSSAYVIFLFWFSLGLSRVFSVEFVFKHRSSHQENNNSFFGVTSLFFFLIGLILLLISVVESLYAFLLSFLSEPKISEMSLLNVNDADIISLVFLGIQVLVIGPIVEELLYRGLPFLFHVSRQQISGLEMNTARTSTSALSRMKVLVIFTSAVFSLAHLPGDMVSGSFSYVITHQFYLFVLGIILSIGYLLSRSLLVSILLHSLNNFVSYVFILMEVLSLEVNISSIFLLILGICLMMIGLGIQGMIFELRSKDQVSHSPPNIHLCKKEISREKNEMQVKIAFFFQLLLFGPGLGIGTLLMTSTNLVFVFFGLIVFTFSFLVCFTISLAFLNK